METPLIRKARLNAFEWHKDQMYGTLPYCFHLMDVVRILLEYGYDNENQICAGYTHDGIEDCGKTKEIITDLLNEKVAKITYACSGEGKNRKEKKQVMIQRLTEYPKGIPVKMSDRLANMRNCKQRNQRMLVMYHRELPDYQHLFEEADPAMWAEMNDLCKGL